MAKNKIDTVDGILPPYSNEFSLWYKDGQLLKAGLEVLPVGMAVTYSVRLDHDGTAAREVFLQVRDGRIINTMALQPLGEKSVFDPRGRYLGRGGEPLENDPPVPKKDIVSAIIDTQADPKSDAPDPAELTKEVDDLLTEVRGDPAKQEPAVEKPPETKGQIDMVIEDSVPTNTGPTLTHVFHLRPNVRVQVTLPVDFTEEESFRFSRFIETLPFDAIPDHR